MDSFLRVVANGFAYFYTGTLVLSFLTMGLAAVVSVAAIVAGLFGAFK